MNIGEAVKSLKDNHAVIRKSWRKRGISLVMPHPTDHEKHTDIPFICMNFSYGKSVPWHCSQSDLLANDWEIL
jgi:hypothetical protein